MDGALVRYGLLGDGARLLELYAALDRDEEAVGFFLGKGEAGLALRLLERRGGESLDPRLVAAAVKALEGRIRDGSGSGEDGALETAAALLLRCLESDEGCAAAGKSLLDLVSDHIDSKTELPSSLEALMMRSRHVGALRASLLGLTPGAPRSAARERLLRELHEGAESASDRTLLAVWASVSDWTLFATLISGLELDHDTVRLFEAAEAEHPRAVAHHLASGDWERAAEVHLLWEEFEEAARLHEEHGRHSEASRLYRRAGDSARALVCARKAGDEAEMARAYEGLEEIQRAIDVWSSLGRRLEVERLRKRLRPERGSPGEGGARR